MNHHNAIDNQANHWLSAAAAAELLGVKRATLYAYASRGKIRTRASGRKRSYLRQDLERIVALKNARAGHGAVAAGALRWGEPVLDSAITEIHPNGPRYRGSSAVRLAASGVSLERAAALLWNLPSSFGWPPTRFEVAPRKLEALLPPDSRPVDAMMVALPALAVVDPARFHPGVPSTLAVARRLIRLLIACTALPRGGAEAARRSLKEPYAARGLLVALGARAGMTASRTVDRALVLCADHELNPSSFAARVAASAGADLYACVGAALATLSGAKHGGIPERVQALLAEIGQPGRAARVVGMRLRRGEEVPGFGHRLYPAGDPRTAPLIEAAREVAPQSKTVRTIDALVDAMQLAGAQPPTLDVGLVALAGALKLGAGGALALFAAGRLAGWVAHVIEQREAGFVLRPRARYTGHPSPEIA